VLALAAVVAFPVHAVAIAVFGSQDETAQNAVASFLVGQGHKADNFGKTVPTAQQLVSGDYDVVIALRQAGNDDIAAFVHGGGLLITEWNASEWALNNAGLLGEKTRDIGGGEISDPNKQLHTITGKGLALGLGKGLGKNPFADGTRTDFARLFELGDPAVDVLGTRPGSEIPAMIGGLSDEGYVLVNGFSWGDNFQGVQADSPTGIWLANAVTIRQAQQVPEPGSLALAGLALAYLALARRRRSARH
jgi:hypothetical protein